MLVIKTSVVVFCCTGATTMAVLPTCRVLSFLQNSNIYDDLPELPFPLEMIALCMLRVLQRRVHEGGLNYDNKTAAGIVIKFACLFKGLTRSKVVQLLQQQFDRVLELEVMNINEGHQVSSRATHPICRGSAAVHSLSINQDPMHAPAEHCIGL